MVCAGSSCALHFPKTNIIIHRVSLSEVKAICGNGQTMGCAQWYRLGDECNIYINENLPVNGPWYTKVMEHEYNHCKLGKFHKE